MMAPIAESTISIIRGLFSVATGIDRSVDYFNYLTAYPRIKIPKSSTSQIHGVPGKKREGFRGGCFYNCHACKMSSTALATGQME